MVTLEEGSVCFRLKMVYLVYVLLDSDICVSNDCSEFYVKTLKSFYRPIPFVCCQQFMMTVTMEAHMMTSLETIEMP